MHVKPCCYSTDEKCRRQVWKLRQALNPTPSFHLFSNNLPSSCSDRDSLFALMGGDGHVFGAEHCGAFLALAAFAGAPDSSGGGRREQHSGLSYGTSRALYGETAAPLAPRPMWSNSSAAAGKRGQIRRNSSFYRLSWTCVLLSAFNTSPNTPNNPDFAKWLRLQSNVF